MMDGDQKQELESLLERYAEFNFDTKWSLYNHHEIKIFGNPYNAYDPKEAKDFLARLRDRADIILPVNSWYRKIYRKYSPAADNNPMEKTSFYDFTTALTADTNVPTYNGVVKVNYTNQTESNENAIPTITPPSFLVGNIEQNKKYLLIDDTFASGKTLRDYIKYISLQGGKVKGIITTDDKFCRHGGIIDFDYSLDRERETMFEAIYKWQRFVETETCGNTSKTYFDKLSNTEKEDFAKQEHAEADRFLKRKGLSFSQMTAGEIMLITRFAERSTEEENIWDGLTKNIPDAIPPEIDDIHKPEELLEFINMSINHPEKLTFIPKQHQR